MGWGLPAAGTLKAREDGVCQRSGVRAPYPPRDGSRRTVLGPEPVTAGRVQEASAEGDWRCSVEGVRMA